jgi:hypothetical protein
MEKLVLFRGSIMKIRCVRSGGQTGADLGGLIAAKEYGLETGGWMPPQFANEQGYHPEWEELYGVKAHQSRGYKPRTWANVKESDGTIRLAIDWKSAGEVCTRNAVRHFKKPFIDVNLKPIFLSDDYKREARRVADWIVANEIVVLNVAGNRESTAPGICGRTQKLLKLIFEILEK